MTKVKKYKYYILIFLFWLVSYYLNITNQLFGGDSAEFSRILVNWEIAHPPGYPLYTLLANTFAIFFSQKQYSLSLLNAMFNLSSAFTIFNIFRKLIKNDFFSFLSVIFFLINFIFWFYGLVPEVFSLTILLLAIQYNCILSLTDININKSKNNLYKYAFIVSLGLSVANHHIFLFFLPGYFYLIFKNKEIHKLFLKNKISNLLLFIFTSLIFYIYIPLTSHINNYIGMTNTKTFDGLIKMITRAPYGSFKAYSGSETHFSNMFFDIFATLLYVFKDFRILGVLFVIFGLTYLFKKNKILFNFFGINSLSLLFFYFYSNFYLNSDFGVSTYERFVLFFYFNILFYLSYGVNYIYQLLSDFFERKSNKGNLKKLAFIFTSVLFGVLILTIYTDNTRTISALKETNIFGEFAKDLLNTPEKGSIAMYQKDNTIFLTLAISKNLKYRNDLVLFNMGYLNKDSRLDQYKKSIYIPNGEYNKKTIKELLDGNYKKGINIYAEQSMDLGFWTPIGLLWKYYPSREAVIKDEEINLQRNKILWDSYHIPKITEDRLKIPFIQDVKLNYIQAMLSYIAMLHISGRNDLALNYLEEYIDQFYYEYMFRNFYIDLKTGLKICDQKLDITISKMLKEEQTNLLEFKDYLIISNYYKNCKNDKLNEKKYLQEYQRLKNLDRMPLEAL